jgi:hypothetical protein
MPESPKRIFLSYARPDHAYALKLKELLTSAGAESVDSATDLKVAESGQLQLRERIAEASTTIVLLGPYTRKSKWVDFEIQIAVSGVKGRLGTALIAVVLPTHEDYRTPFYDPELVPLRVHDLIVQEFALLRKWTEDSSEILPWIEEAQRRRKRIRNPCISFKTSFALREFNWDPTIDNSPIQAN